ncbi:MAG: hypothetical protein V1848_00655 [Candidatus Magasanikbacteria bacterium]
MVNGISFSDKEQEGMRILRRLQVFTMLDLARKLADRFDEWFQDEHFSEEYWRNLVSKCLHLSVISLVPRLTMDENNIRLGASEYVFHDDSYFELVHFLHSGSSEEFISSTRKTRERNMDLLRELFFRPGRKTVFARNELSDPNPDIQQIVTAFGVIQEIVEPVLVPIMGNQHHFRFTPKAHHILHPPDP